MHEVLSAVWAEGPIRWEEPSGSDLRSARSAGKAFLLSSVQFRMLAIKKKRGFSELQRVSDISANGSVICTPKGRSDRRERRVPFLTIFYRSFNSSMYFFARLYIAALSHVLPSEILVKES